MEKYFAGALAGIVGVFSHISTMVLCALIFIAIDFVSGILADRHRVRAAGGTWLFESAKAWRTVRKTACVMAGIVLAWLIDRLLLDVATLHLAKIFTGFVCGVEFWSYLENAAEISSSPIFSKFKEILKKRMGKIK